jgi:hypothetical protein
VRSIYCQDAGLVDAGTRNAKESSMHPKVIFIISEKSSGSTILKDEIARHPDIRLVRKTEHNSHETLYWVKAACLLNHNAEDFMNGRPLWRPGVARKKLIRLLRDNVPDFKMPKDDRQLVFEGWNALCEGYRPVFLEKSPHHIQHWAALQLILEYVNSTDHDVKIVGLVRNPLAMVYSANQRWNTDPEERQFIWMKSYQNLLRFRDALPGKNFMLIQYCDLVDRPAETLKSICEFAEIGYYPEIGSDVHSESIQKWKTDPDFHLKLDARVASFARKFGYDEAELENPNGCTDKAEAQTNWIRKVLKVLT